MNTHRWSALDEAGRDALLARPGAATHDDLREAVARVIEQVRMDGDATLRALTRRYDNVELADLAVDESEFEAAARTLPDDLKAAIEASRARIDAFHAPSALQPYAVETAPGVHCERIVRAIARVGLYVPAGSAPLPSTALMLGVPARLAGCASIVLCTPPRPDGAADPSVLYAARLCGIRRVFKLGGAQAIAAMAFGTGSVPRCDKLFGPGNAYVTEAKRQVAQAAGGPAIDLPAGPSELMVIADRTGEPAYIASDLLSQAEHGPDSQVLLVSDDAGLIAAVGIEIDRQLADLPRASIAGGALQASRAFLVEDLDDAFEIANRYAPEHLILQVADPRAWLPRIESAGSVFLGRHAPEAIGDYTSGTNHVLPTGGAARATGGVSVASFQKAITVQQLDAAALRAIGPDAVRLAQAEGLAAHARAISIRIAGSGPGTP